jgi:hypothetical protein
MAADWPYRRSGAGIAIGFRGGGYGARSPALFRPVDVPGGAAQDSWDDITDKITTTFLGFKTECISCHNGRGHLEKIN